MITMQRIRDCYAEHFQGHRWMFEKQVYTDKATMQDTQGEFPIVELPSDMAELLSQQLGMLQGYQNDDRKHLLLVNLLLEFIKENKDVDKDVMIALINNLDYLVVK